MRDKTYMLTARLSSFMLSVVLMASSLLKAVNVHSFATEVVLFSDAYVSSALAPFGLEIACAVCALELFLSMLLLCGRFEFLASLLSFAMLTFFVSLTGMNLFAPASIGSIESCGCFGELIHFSPLGTFVKSVVLWCVSIMCMLALRKGVRFCGCARKVRKRGHLCVLVFLFVSVVPPMFSLLCMERMNAEAYVSCYVVVCVAIISFAFGWIMPQVHKLLKIDDALLNRVRKGGEKTTESE